ncbi:unnamed protein product [Blepharisma stoltei]|uniref:Uncharacterized protein n=1 Tax=Blepharisma stoltei TaxID=1481888 RepID=A0AAU9J7U4_9CILI|nr:unnamed protein product [Blepharisma stoltei]
MITVDSITYCNVGVQVTDGDFKPETDYSIDLEIKRPTFDLSAILVEDIEGVEEETTQISKLQQMLYHARHELAEQERLNELHQIQIKFLKQEIQDLNKKFKLITNFEGENIFLNANLLKETAIKLISGLPMLNSEGEGLISILFSLLDLNDEQWESINVNRRKTKQKVVPGFCLFS